MEHLLAGVYREGQEDARIDLKIPEVGGLRAGTGVSKGGLFQGNIACFGPYLFQPWKETLSVR